MFTRMIAEIGIRKDTFLKMCLFVLIFHYLLIFLFLQYFWGRGRVKSVSFLLKMFLSNYFNNLRLAVLPNFPFTTSETMRDYYL